jgi:hypothetical protein
VPELDGNNAVFVTSWIAAHGALLLLVIARRVIGRMIGE